MRRKLGLPGLTVGWGPIANVGYVVERENVLVSARACSGIPDRPSGPARRQRKAGRVFTGGPCVAHTATLTGHSAACCPPVSWRAHAAAVRSVGCQGRSVLGFGARR